MAQKESRTPQIVDFFNDIDPEQTSGAQRAAIGPPSIFKQLF
jgi:hypothetical protein